MSVKPSSVPWKRILILSNTTNVQFLTLGFTGLMFKGMRLLQIFS